MSDRNRVREGEGEMPGKVADADQPAFTYAEVVQAGTSFGVSNETVAGALVAAGIPRDAHLTRKMVEEAVKAFATREVED